MAIRRIAARVLGKLLSIMPMRPGLNDVLFTDTNKLYTDGDLCSATLLIKKTAISVKSIPKW